MNAVDQLRRVGNLLYRFGFPVYRPLYRAFKTYADRVERDLLRTLLTNGSVVVDAGANVGVYSQFLAARVGSSGVVHSFEPDPLNCSRLRAAVSGLSNVRINEVAVSNQTGKAVLFISDRLNVDHRTYLTAKESRRTVPIRTTKLDDYFRPGERIDMIKLDIQGYEFHALCGAERVLNENPAIKLLLEFWPHGLEQAGIDWTNLIDYLKDRDMDIQEISPAGPRPFCSKSVRDSPDWYVNLFAYRAEGP